MRLLTELASTLFFCCHLENQVAFREPVFSFLINDYLEGLCVCVCEESWEILNISVFQQRKRAVLSGQTATERSGLEARVKAGLADLC